MDISIVEKIKSRKLAAFVAAGVMLNQLAAPWNAYLYLAIAYFASEAIQMSAEAIANALKKGV